MKRLFADIVKNYLGKPYRVNGMGPDGYDCIGLIVSICEDMGAAMPDRYFNWDRTNYASEWYALLERDPQEARSILKDFMSRIGKEAPIRGILAGDIVVCRQPDGKLVPAIYLGNGQALSSWPQKGVTAFAVDQRNAPILARRVRNA